MSRVPTAAVAASSLVLGFAAVRVGGPQWLGAVVVLAGAAWCVAREARRTAWWRPLRRRASMAWLVAMVYSQGRTGRPGWYWPLLR